MSCRSFGQKKSDLGLGDFHGLGLSLLHGNLPYSQQGYPKFLILTRQIPLTLQHGGPWNLSFNPSLSSSSLVSGLGLWNGTNSAPFFLWEMWLPAGFPLLPMQRTDWFLERKKMCGRECENRCAWSVQKTPLESGQEAQQPRGDKLEHRHRLGLLKMFRYEKMRLSSQNLYDASPMKPFHRYLDIFIFTSSDI